MYRRTLYVLLCLTVLGLAACSGVGPQVAGPTPVSVASPAAQPVGATPAAAEPNAGAALGDDATLRTFTIAADRSQVRFVIDEVLRGAPTTVVGTNSAVSGRLMVDPANPANTQIGPIEVDAAGFVTDEDRRNGAIRRFILRSDQYPTVSFLPTAIQGLPQSAAVGDTFSFQITGNLTLLEATNLVTFDVTATVVSEDEIEIAGTTRIDRADFGISIPSVPFVASVEEEMAIEVDLVAVAGAE